VAGRAHLKAVPSWDDYLSGFHAERAGITERVLRLATSGGRDAYAWLLEAVPGRPGDVVDLACGSAPLWPVLGESARSWTGVDASDGELALAAERGAASLVRADVTALPLPDRCADVVVCAMSLQLVQPLERALAEVARVLRPGGTFVATVPVNRPVLPRDLRVLLPVLTALRSRLGYPNDDALEDPARAFADAGLTLGGDERLRFGLPVPDADAGRLWLESLYLPGVPAERVAAAGRAVERAVPTVLPVPVRRLVATRR
jgi:SAM-dependent methyltransferase